MSDKKRDYSLFLNDIVQACEKIERYTNPFDYNQFSVNEMAIDAVIRNFEVIGEAIRNIPNELKNAYPQVEWQEAVGFRNIMIHNYFGIDLEAVWETVQKNIPLLKSHILDVDEMQKKPEF